MILAMHHTIKKLSIVAGVGLLASLACKPDTEPNTQESCSDANQDRSCLDNTDDDTTTTASAPNSNSSTDTTDSTTTETGPGPEQPLDDGSLEHRSGDGGGRGRGRESRTLTPHHAPPMQPKSVTGSRSKP